MFVEQEIPEITPDALLNDIPDLRKQAPFQSQDLHNVLDLQESAHSATVEADWIKAKNALLASLSKK